METIGFVGAGNMACALGGGIARATGEQYSVVASDPSPEARTRFVEETGGSACETLAALAALADVLILAVKPQILPGLLPEIAAENTRGALIVSIAAGISLGSMQTALGSGARIIRAMPNTPALIRRGMTVLVPGPAALPEDLELARTLFATAGRVLTAENESVLDAVTAVSGSGPGFLFAYAEAMIDAGVRAGLSREMTNILVKETLAGSAELWRSSEKDVGTLRAQVTSPGGTTEAGLNAMVDQGLSKAVDAAIAAATARSRELSGN
jgi:pyrroline-5-carboxylate reductase